MPRSISSGLAAAIFLALFLAIVFVLCGVLRFGFSWPNAALLAVVGFVFGGIGAPELEPKAFRFPALWQMFFSTLGCLLLAKYFDAGADGYLLASLVGVVLGFLAPYWIKHLQAP